MLREDYQSPTSPNESEDDRAAAPAAGHAPKVWQPKLDQVAETPQQQERKPSEKATDSEKKNRLTSPKTRRSAGKELPI